ncbi:MAG: DNA-3-methyladenine glycosylase 2 family protein [Terriglobia bacterium]|nr:DNA-3-methyladenine glycosylase 2 family protein [Terriglobia bacterium]
MTPAIKHLRKSDQRFAEWIDRIGTLELPTPPLREPYVALLEGIAHQQLAGAAARAIWARVSGLFANGVVCPIRLAEMSEADLRAAGLSRSKALAMKDICVRVNAGKIPSAALIAQMTDAEIYAQLMEARGVGMWTVDMLMMFTLCRPDVMPATDYGVRKGFQVLYRKRALPSPKQLLKHSEKWQPHRSVAALYLWRISESAKKNQKAKKKSLSK